MEWTIGNPKTVKGQKKGYLTAVLHLAPAHQARVRVNGHVVSVCPMSTAGCRKACLNKAGRGGVFPNIAKARNRKTRELFRDKWLYLSKLSDEINRLKLVAKSKGLTLVVRPNGTSDLPSLALALADAHPEVQFYDYTKIPRPWTRQRPNYHLTFSLAETKENHVHAHEALEHGISVAVVFAVKKGQPLPKTWWGHRVIDGDETDLRFLDKRGVIVGLRAKGPAKKDCSGFVQSV